MPTPISYSFADLQGRTAVLTGAARGIGRGLTPILLQQGMNVLLVDRDEDGLRETETSVSAEPGQVSTFVADLADPGERERLAPKLHDSVDGIDAIIHNAAIDPRQSLEKTSTDFFRHVIATNVEPAIELTRDLLPDLKASPGGRVVLVGSLTFQIGTALLSTYVASKGAIAGLTRSLAHELGPHGITVNCIHPGAIRVEKEAALYTEETDRIVLEAQSVKRRLVPADLAGLVCLLLSDAGGAISGQEIGVDGGLVHPIAAASTQAGMLEDTSGS